MVHVIPSSRYITLHNKKLLLKWRGFFRTSCSIRSKFWDYKKERRDAGVLKSDNTV